MRRQLQRPFRAAAWLGVAVLAACGGQSVNERSGTNGTSGTGGSRGGSSGKGGLSGGSGGSGGSTGGSGGTSPGSGGSSAGGASSGGMGGAGGVVCIYGDQVYRPGDSFRSVDDCNTCYCANDGTIGCTLIDCAGSGGTGGSAGVGGTAGTGGTAGQGGAASCHEPPIGQICLRGRQGTEGETLSVGDELRIELRPLGCYSSSCTELVRADCALQPVEGGYVVTGGVCLAGTGDEACTADCGGGGVAECTTELLVEGSYWLTFNDFQLQFSVPGTLGPGGRCESLVVIGLPAR